MIVATSQNICFCPIMPTQIRGHTHKHILDGQIWNPGLHPDVIKDLTRDTTVTSKMFIDELIGSILVDPFQEWIQHHLVRGGGVGGCPASPNGYMQST